MAAPNKPGNFPAPEQYGMQSGEDVPGAKPEGIKHGFAFVNHDNQMAPPPIWGSGSPAHPDSAGQPMQKASPSAPSKGRNVK